LPPVDELVDEAEAVDLELEPVQVASPHQRR
jgi:hypothetical protein